MADDNDQFDDVTFKEFRNQVFNKKGFTTEEWKKYLSAEAEEAEGKEEMKHRAVKRKPPEEKEKTSPPKKEETTFYNIRSGGMIGSNKIIKGYKKGGQV
tara:strand:- start:452 stop:748 length:297 start_codon:yes stop_codon:yes gene_type:complete